ncbi:hypothetical protein OB919_15275 [Halobacteria archaeon AArc-curdl1]|uniref:Uncharacterized protein n=1 Tax=Natronosalvus hydrolyticus TaxID=2979988 RepID=A0AAP2ZAG5_9EURY|nr:hypothetical protein [Halobacteria archaeon AArc-curdl1]
MAGDGTEGWGCGCTPSAYSSVRETHEPPSRRGMATRVSGLDSSGASTGEATEAGGEATIHVRCYPQARMGPTGTFGWAPAHRRAALAVRDALETLADEAESRTDLDAVHWRLEAGRPVALDMSEREGTLDGVTDAFDEVLEDREVLTGSCCHLLLAWQPLNQQLGYGGTPSAHRRVGAGDALTVANIGATETWDNRRVTANMAIHEVVHTFLSRDSVEAVVDSRCDHDLGSVREVEPGVREVSPMATAYAGAGTDVTDTQFAGSGCGHHEAFYHHDGTDDVERWLHTRELSEGTLEAASHYLATALGNNDP